MFYKCELFSGPVHCVKKTSLGVRYEHGKSQLRLFALKIVIFNLLY